MIEYLKSSKVVLKKYFNNLNPIILDYFKILSEEIPEFLYDYIETPEMMRLDGISTLVGYNHIKFIKSQFEYSVLSHSIAVALMTWHFTKDKKQTLAALFHCISSPAFKPCVSFIEVNNEKGNTSITEIIKGSKDITLLLERDGIDLEEINNSQIYPVVYNNIPKLSVTRLEYIFSDSLVITQVWSLEEIKKIYNDLEILKNEDGIDELGFTDEKLADRFIDGSSLMWYLFQGNEIKLKTKFWSDIIKKMIKIKEITKDDLYKLSEKEIIEKIENCNKKSILERFKKFRELETINEGEKKPFNKYTVKLKTKRRYIVPLVKDKRITEISDFSKNIVDNFLKYSSPTYGWFDFNFL